MVLPANGAVPVNLAPVADIAAANTSGLAPLAVGLDGTGSSDSDGALVSYQWDFGDGQRGTGPTANHTYTAPGRYTATLTVTDDAGATASARVTVDVLSATTALAAPSNLYSQLSGGQVRVQWTDNARGEEGFIVERSPGTWPTNFQELGRVGANVSTFTDAQPPQGTSYYRVRAYKASAFSAYSNMDGTVR